MDHCNTHETHSSGESRAQSSEPCAPLRLQPATHVLSGQLAAAVFATHGDGRPDRRHQHDGADDAPDDAARGGSLLRKTSACRKTEPGPTLVRRGCESGQRWSAVAQIGAGKTPHIHRCTRKTLEGSLSVMETFLQGKLHQL